MRYVILRDDDTNALTPVESLERLYRPFLARGLPVCLATIPAVRTSACTPDGRPEGFLLAAKGDEPSTVPLAANPGLVAYLRANPGFEIVQHGCHHDRFEFDTPDAAEVVARLERGAACLREAGLSPASAFVAPHDKFSRIAYREAARRFRVISSGWFEWRRLPVTWLPGHLWRKARREPHWRAGHLWRKARREPHWRVGGTRLLSHPGCLLSYAHDPGSILDRIRHVVEAQQLTVLVTHWWEYFRGGRPDEPFIRALHQTADYLGSHPDICVTTFGALGAARGWDAVPAPGLELERPARAVPLS